MTSLEHVFSDQLQQHQQELERGHGHGHGHGLMDRPSSRAGSDRSGGCVGERERQVVEVQGEEEGKQVDAKVAVSGSDDEDEHVDVDVDVDVGDDGEEMEEEQEQELGYEGEREKVSVIVIGEDVTEDEDSNGREDDEDELQVASGSGVSLGVDVGSESLVSRSPPLRGRLSGVSSPGSASRSRSRSGSRSGSPSQSHSHSQSGSPSRSSIKEALEMGESSTATSWTQADRPSGDSERRPSADQQAKEKLMPTEEVADMRTGEVGREGREAVFGLARLRGDASGELKSRKEELLVVQEEDIGEGWHPLRYNGKERSQEDDDEKGVEEREEDLGSIGPLESTQGGKSSLEMSEKERWRAFGSAGRNSKHLRLEFKSPSPLPWDEDRQTDNNETYMSDYYSTLNSKKFGTLQKGRRRTLIPHSAYYFAPPPPDAAYGSAPVGQIGVHHPREIVRIERDYGGGELTQFLPTYPLELEGRITPTQFLQTINDINEILISAHSVRRAFVDNLLAVITLQLSTLVMSSHYTREMRRLKRKINELNTQLYNPVGLNILWPQKVAFLFLEIEYY